MNNVNMSGMAAMGGPVGGAVPMNGVPNRPPIQVNDNQQQRSQLNTYIYEYFLRNGMYDCARSLLNSEQPIKVIKDSPGRRREDGNGGDEGADGDSKDDIDSKRPDDLPAPDVPRECPESCFLYEWWCLFWDMFNAQRGKGDGRNVLQYVNHTQAQSRMRQDAQQNMLRGIRGDMMPAQYQQMMMRNQANGMTNELRQKAMQNNRNATPQQLQMMQQQQKQQQMQRDPSSGDHQQRVGSPGSAENAPSPSKRPRLDGGAPFNPQQLPNGRGQSQGMPQQVGESGPSNAIQAAHMQLTNGIEPNNLTAQQFQNMPGGANVQQAGLAGYQAGLARQQQSQMPNQMVGKMPNTIPQSQGSPMMAQGQQDGGAIAGYYNAGEMGPNGGMRAGQPGGQPGGGNHALQDYQMQLMLLEQQNKKRLMMARQEQDSMTVPGREGQVPGVMGANGQPFQQGTSPQGARSVNSPNPSEQMKRGTPHMNPAGMASPLPEGQSRGSPSGMNFNIPGGQMDPNMGPQYFKMNGMDPNMVGAMPNGMRPPSSHPGGGFVNGSLTSQQMAMAQQQQQQRQAAANASWQTAPNGQMMPGQNQGGPPQPMGQGTPQQRAMPPPSAVPAGNAANGRTQPSSPQQGAAPPTPQQSNKAAPKKKKDAKETTAAKRATKKVTAANLNAGATPSADASQEPATPTPATPITPVHPKSFQNGTAQPVPNGQPAALPAQTNVAPPQPDPLGGGFGMGDTNFEYPSLDFANPNNGNMDVLQDFDFDSFLHQDGDAGDSFNFDAFGGLDGNEIGAE